MAEPDTSKLQGDSPGLPAAPTVHPLLVDSEDALIARVQEFTRVHMSQYDSSHDWQHIKRVVALAHQIYAEVTSASGMERHYNKTLMHLAALLHDICDHKYLRKTLMTTGSMTSIDVPRSATALLHQTLRNPPLLIPTALALPLEEIIMHVSYSTECRDPSKVQKVLDRHPELAIVQDADRLDAIGAIGIGRCFTYGATRAAESKFEGSAADEFTSSMAESLIHFDEKLLKIEAMMKTDPGKRMAKERTDRLRSFKRWWQEEAGTV